MRVLSTASPSGPPSGYHYGQSNETSIATETTKVDNVSAILGVAIIWSTVIFVLLCISAMSRLFASVRQRIRFLVDMDDATIIVVGLSGEKEEVDRDLLERQLEKTKVLLKEDNFRHQEEQKAHSESPAGASNTTPGECSAHGAITDVHPETIRVNGDNVPNYDTLERFESIDLEWDGGEGNNEVSSSKDLIEIPVNGEETKATVSNLCAICLSTYKVGETVVWSPNPSCHLHVFHEACINQVLLQGDTKCPMCRQEFVLLNGAKEKDVGRCANEGDQ